MITKKKEKGVILENNTEAIVDNKIIVNKNDTDTSLDIDVGKFSIMDYIAPESIKKGLGKDDVDFLRVGGLYVRNFVLTGYPRQVYVTWLDKLLNGKSTIDTMMHIIPISDKTALDSLTMKITQYEAQLQIEKEKGKVTNLTRFQDILDELYEERRKLERNTEKLFHFQLSFNLYCHTKEELEKETQLLDAYFRGRSMKIMPMSLRQDLGYNTVAPIGKSYFPDMYRNFNSGAITGCFPFYNSEMIHKNGVFCGVNALTMMPAIINFYDKKIFTNANISVLGQGGMGKSFFVTLLTIRSALNGINTAIIDAEGEYKKPTELLGGTNIELKTNSSKCINPFDIEEEDIMNNDGIPTGIKTVNINDKVSDILNLIEVMVGGMDGGLRSTSSKIIQQLYYERGITNDPKSLYVSEPSLDVNSQVFYHNGMKKVMPKLSDFQSKLYEYSLKESDIQAKKLSETLQMFLSTGIYGMFDCYTSPELENLKDAPIINFDVSSLEDKILRPIGMYVALTWIWEKFVKKNPMVFKRVVCDEAWMMVSKNMAGSQYSAAFLENVARRIRKYKGGLLVSSQNFSEFNGSEQGKAVLNQAKTKIFLGQDPSDIDEMQKMFKLSDGEKNFMLQAKRGQILIKSQNNSEIINVTAFEQEKKLIEKKA